MKKLFICLTDFQVINAICLQRNNSNDIQADILCVTNKEGNYEMMKRIQALGIFDKVYLFNNSRIKGLHRYIRNMVEGKNGEKFFEALKNSIDEIFYKIRCKFYNDGYVINAKMVLGGDMNFSIYDNVFCLDNRKFVVDCVKQILKATDNKCKVNLLDEGTSTYWRSILTKNFPINNVYLTVPKLANYYNEGWKNRIKEIPAINMADDEFRSILNVIFAFSDDDQYTKEKNGLYELRDRIIFFDQNWDPMPEYFAKLNRIMLILLHNPYKKHKKESTFYERKMDIFRIAADNANGNSVVVKLHPRSPMSFIDDYKKSACTMLPSLKIPWEVFMDNCVFKNNIWITVSSTALCTYKMAFANRREEIPMIFLYKIVYKGNTDFHEDDEFFQRFRRMYPESVYIPNTIEEYKLIYETLVEKMSKWVDNHE